MTNKSFHYYNTFATEKLDSTCNISEKDLRIQSITCGFAHRIEREVNALREQVENREDAYLKRRRVRYLTTQDGKIPIEIPVFKNLSYFPSFVEPYQRKNECLCEKINLEVKAGCSTRAIEEMYLEMGIEGVSKSSVSRIAHQFEKEVEDFKARRFDGEKYLNLQIDAMYFYIRQNGLHGHYYKKMALVRVIGLSVRTGVYEHLDISVQPSECAEAIRSVLKDLKDRGLKDPAIITTDSGNGIRQGVREVSPHSFWQPCEFHDKKSDLESLDSKEDFEIRQEILEVYKAKDMPKAWKALEKLQEKYKANKKYSKALASVENSLAKGSPVKAIKDEEIAKQLRTSNRTEGQNGITRRHFDSKRSFPSAESAEFYLIRQCLQQDRLQQKKGSELNIQSLVELYESCQEQYSQAYEQACREIEETFVFDAQNEHSEPAHALWIQIAYIPIMVRGAQCSLPVLFAHAGYEDCIQLLGGRALWENTSGCIQEQLESLLKLGPGVSEKPLIVLPYAEEELLKAAQSVFPQALFQIDQQDFVEKILYLIPKSLEADTLCFFEALYAYEDSAKAFELGEIIIDYLSMHKLDEAAQALKEALPYLLGGVTASPLLTGAVLSLASFRFGSTGGMPGTSGLVKRPKSVEATFKQISKGVKKKRPRFWKKSVIRALKKLEDSST